MRQALSGRGGGLLRTRDSRSTLLQFSHKAFARQLPDQLSHLQREQDPRQFRDWQFARFAERVDVRGFVRREQAGRRRARLRGLRRAWVLVARSARQNYHLKSYPCNTPQPEALERRRP